MPSKYPRLLIAWLLFASCALGNVEKTIFLGPVALEIPSGHPTIQDLQLPVLSPTNSSLRTSLAAEFPSATHPAGVASWFLLQGLTKGKRYEVRICWAATQPTAFDLITHELPDVFGSPDLVSSLAAYSRSSQPSLSQPPLPSIASHFKKPGHDLDELQSILLLQISATAEYFTMNQTLMQNVPPVLVDIILDPFILNVLPSSLSYTAVYLIFLAVLAFGIAKLTADWLCVVSRADDKKKKQ